MKHDTPTPDAPAFLASEFTPAPRGQARFHVIPAPLEQTVSYGGGTGGGPAAILRASQQLEAFDGTGQPGQAGICTLPFIDCSGHVERVIDRIEAAVHGALAAPAIPVLLGGEHSVTIGAFRALSRLGRPVGIVQFDAHADLRERYEGSPFSHACVMHHALTLGLPFVQAGIRSLSQAEHDLRAARGVVSFDAARLAAAGPGAFALPPGFPDEVYVTFDIDAFDPALVPATGTPEPGGLDWYAALHVLGQIAGQRRIIGFDVVELAPIPGLHASDFTAAKLVYRLMGLCR